MEKKQVINTFDALNAVDVNGHTERKGQLTYLSWAWAWAEVKKRFPDASYAVTKFDGRPYLYDASLGYMCETSVTINGETLTMWLPVMDHTNRALKAEPYGTVKQGATMYEINKTIMRCLVKNLAMFGLGLYIYAGEDLPEAVVEQQQAQIAEAAAAFRACPTLADLLRAWDNTPEEIRPSVQTVATQRRIELQQTTPQN